jgi:hypothetical protein
MRRLPGQNKVHTPCPRPMARIKIVSVKRLPTANGNGQDATPGNRGSIAMAAKLEPIDNRMDRRYASTFQLKSLLSKIIRNPYSLFDNSTV